MIRTTSLFVAFTLLLSSCGFQLRGSIALPEGWQTVGVTAAAESAELSRDLSSALAAAGVEVSESSNITVHLGVEEMRRRNVAIDVGATASEFELVLATTMAVSDERGEFVMSPTELSVQRLMDHNPNNVVGEAEETRLIQRELRAELVQQILRRLRFLARSHADQS